MDKEELKIELKILIQNDPEVRSAFNMLVRDAIVEILGDYVKLREYFEKNIFNTK